MKKAFAAAAAVLLALAGLAYFAHAEALPELSDYSWMACTFCDVAKATAAPRPTVWAGTLPSVTCTPVPMGNKFLLASSRTYAQPTPTAFPTPAAGSFYYQAEKDGAQVRFSTTIYAAIPITLAGLTAYFDNNMSLYVDGTQVFAAGAVSYPWPYGDPPKLFDLAIPAGWHNITIYVLNAIGSGTACNFYTGSPAGNVVSANIVSPQNLSQLQQVLVMNSQGVPTGDKCIIDGEIYSLGEPNPTNPCLRCMPLTSAGMVSWSSSGVGDCAPDGLMCSAEDLCQEDVCGPKRILSVMSEMNNGCLAGNGCYGNTLRMAENITWGAANSKCFPDMCVYSTIEQDGRTGGGGDLEEPFGAYSTLEGAGHVYIRYSFYPLDGGGSYISIDTSDASKLSLLAVFGASYYNYGSGIRVLAENRKMEFVVKASANAAGDATVIFKYVGDSSVLASFFRVSAQPHVATCGNGICEADPAEFDNPESQTNCCQDCACPSGEACLRGAANMNLVQSSGFENGLPPMNGDWKDGVYDSDPSLVAYWKLDNNPLYGEGASAVYDYSGRGNNGVLYGGTFSGAKFGKGLKLAGGSALNSQYADIANENAFDISGDMAISFWFNHSMPSGTDTVMIGKHMCGTGAGYYVIANRPLNTGKIGFYYSPTAEMQSSRGSLNDGQWHHAVMQKNSTHQMIYIDGAFDSAKALTNVYVANAIPFQIASLSGTTASCVAHLNGTIDNVMVYNRTLSPAEILAQYSAAEIPRMAESSGVFANDPAMRAYWRFDNDPAFGENNTLAYDYSSNGKNAAIYPGATYTTDAKGGKALSFDGASGYANVSINFDGSWTEGTIEAWAKAADFNLRNLFVYTQEPAYTSLTSFTHQLAFSNSTSGLNRTIAYWWTGATHFLNTPAPAMLINQWYHVAFVWKDNTFARVYVNSVKSVEATGTGVGVLSSTNAAGNRFQIGKNSGAAGLNNFFKGAMDNVMIYRRALSDSELLAHYNAVTLPSASDAPETRAGSVVFLPAGSTLNASNVITALPLVPYEFSIMVKNETPASAFEVRLREFGDAGLDEASGCTVSGPASGWTQKTCSFTTKPTTRGIKISLVSLSGGFYATNVSLTTTEAIEAYSCVSTEQGSGQLVGCPYRINPDFSNNIVATNIPGSTLAFFINGKPKDSTCLNVTSGQYPCVWKFSSDYLTQDCFDYDKVGANLSVDKNRQGCPFASPSFTPLDSASGLITRARFRVECPGISPEQSAVITLNVYNSSIAASKPACNITSNITCDATNPNCTVLGNSTAAKGPFVANLSVQFKNLPSGTQAALVKCNAADAGVEIGLNLTGAGWRLCGNEFYPIASSSSAARASAETEDALCTLDIFNLRDSTPPSVSMPSLIGFAGNLGTPVNYVNDSLGRVNLTVCYDDGPAGSGPASCNLSNGPANTTGTACPTTTPPECGGQQGFATTFAVDTAQQGNRTIYFTVTDAAGNANTTSANITFDSNKPFPVLVLSMRGGTANEGYSNDLSGAITANVTYSDAVSGAAKCGLSNSIGAVPSAACPVASAVPPLGITMGHTIDASAQGSKAVYFTVLDRAGNSNNHSATITLDAGPPTEPQLVSIGSGPVISWPAGSTDAVSGVKGYEAQLNNVASLADANWITFYSATACPAAGTCAITCTSYPTACGIRIRAVDQAGNPSGWVYPAYSKSDLDFAGGTATGTAVVGTGADANVTQPVGVENPIDAATQAAYWKFDNNASFGETAALAYDYTGKGNGVTCSGAACPIYAQGMFGNAMKFDGVNDYMQAPNSASLNPTSQITLEAWIRPTWDYQEQEPIILKSFTSHTAPYYQYYLFWYNTITAPHGVAFGVKVNDGSTATTGVSKTNAFAPGSWHHVVGTYDGAAIVLYVDGEQVASVPKTGAISTYTTVLTLGHYANSPVSTSPVYFFNGSIDNAVVYSTALTAAQVRDHYLAGAVSKGSFESKAIDAGRLANWTSANWSTPVAYQQETNASGALGHWKFENNPAYGESATSAFDYSGNGKTGTISGAVYDQGKFGNGLKFDGVNDYVNFGTGLFLTGPHTLESWVKFNSLPNNAYVPVSLIQSFRYGLWYYPGNTAVSPITKPYLRAHTYATSTTLYYVDTPGLTLSAGRWYYLVQTYDGTNLRIYVNGELKATGKTSSAATTTNDAVLLGRGWNTAGTSFMNGAIDNVAIYNRALSDSEITDRYKQGALNLSIEVAASNSAAGPWTAWSAPYYGAQSAQLPTALGRYVKYRANLTTEQIGFTPVLQDVSLNYTAGCGC